MGSSKEDVIEFPGAVRREVGYALYLAQIGMRAIKTKPLKGFGGAGVLEIVSNYDGSTFRAVYTVNFKKAVFVLHAFQKKSVKGTKTPREEIDQVKRRLTRATELYQQKYGTE